MGSRVVRFPDWQTRMRDAILARIEEPPSWGKHDCAAGAAYLLEAITGENLFPEFDRYDSLQGARDLMFDMSGEYEHEEHHLEKAAEIRMAEHGCPEVMATRAQRGDLCLVKVDVTWVLRPGDIMTKLERIELPDRSLGVVDMSGKGVLVPHFKWGWASIPVSQIIRAWRI